MGIFYEKQGNIDAVFKIGTIVSYDPWSNKYKFIEGKVVKKYLISIEGSFPEIFYSMIITDCSLKKYIGKEWNEWGYNLMLKREN